MQLFGCFFFFLRILGVDFNKLSYAVTLANQK